MTQDAPQGAPSEQDAPQGAPSEQDAPQGAPSGREDTTDESDKADLALIRKAEAVLSEIDRTQGLIDGHADVLAALRIRIEGGPRKTLEELMGAAGQIRGRQGAELDERLAKEDSRRKGDLGDLMAREPKRGKSLDDLLG